MDNYRQPWVLSTLGREPRYLVGLEILSGIEGSTQNREIYRVLSRAARPAQSTVLSRMAISEALFTILQTGIPAKQTDPDSITIPSETSKIPLLTVVRGGYVRRRDVCVCVCLVLCVFM